MNENRKPALELRDYTVCYKGADTPVLSHVSMSLAYGELAVLAGLSGEGKSTLLSSCNGVIPNFTPADQEGEVLVNGESILGQPIAKIARTVGSVLQNAENQIVHARVEDEIAFACENLCLPPEEIRERIQKACDWMDLEPEWETAPLSGGQKQRLITATTLAMGQKILLLDEPLANLDVEGAHRLMSALKQLTREKDYAILVVEHRLDMVVPYADRILWMENRTVRRLKSGERPDQAVRLGTEREAAVSGNCLLKANNLSYQVSGKEILQGISFSVHENDRIVILGENGCGKTTLLRLLSGLVQPSGGSIESLILPGIRKGKKRRNAAWFKQVGVIEQNPNYQLFMPTVWQEVMCQAESREWAEWLLEAFGLQKLKKQHPQSLSEGQKRKVSTAAILAMKPKLLLMDEPTVGQDIQSLQNLFKVLDQLRQMEEGAQVVVTHDRRFAEAFADRVIWMKKGKLHQIGGAPLCKEYFQSLQQIPCSDP